MRIPTRVSRELLAALNHAEATTGSSRNAIVARVVENAVARFPEDPRGRRAFRQRLAAHLVRGAATEPLSIDLPLETARALRELGGRNRRLKPSALMRLLLAREFLPVEVAALASVSRTRVPRVITPGRLVVPSGRLRVLEGSPASQLVEGRPLPERLPRPHAGIRHIPQRAPVVLEALEQQRIVNAAVQLKPYLSPDDQAKLGPMLAAAGISLPENLKALPAASGGAWAQLSRELGGPRDAFDRPVTQPGPPRRGSAGRLICPECVPYGGADGRLELCLRHQEQALRMLWHWARGV